MTHAAHEIRRPRIRGSWILPGLLLLAATAFVAPDGATADADTVTRAQRDARIELGRRLFFEPDASPSGLRACASCHDPNHGFSDPKRLSADDFGITTRHSQTIIDSADNPSAHWDGEFRNVRQLVRKRVGSSVSPWQAAPSSPVTLPPLALQSDGFVTFDNKVVRFVKTKMPTAPAVRTFETERVAERMAVHRRYERAFQVAFGSPKITVERMAKAIEAYCKTVKSTEAPIDRYLHGDKAALSEAAKRGLALFRGRAGCAECHTMEGTRPAFTDYRFHNTGIAWSGVETRYGADQVALMGKLMQDARLQLRVKGLERVRGPIELLADRGRGRRTHTRAMVRRFKTPTLRDVAKRPPYMHDGRMKTLEEVVRYYAKGCCQDDPLLDARLGGQLVGFEASDRDVADLVAFLEALSGDERPGLAQDAWEARVETQRVRFFNAYGKPMKNAPVILRPEGDVVPVDGEIPEPKVRLVRTDAKGIVEFAPGPTTHTRVQLAGYADPGGDVLVPDTCEEARLELMVSDGTKFIVRLRSDQTPPDELVFVGDPKKGNARKFVFPRTSLKVDKDGEQEATYEGWAYRYGNSQEVKLELPGSNGTTITVLRPGRVTPIDLRSDR